MTEKFNCNPVCFKDSHHLKEGKKKKRNHKNDQKVSKPSMFQGQYAPILYKSL